MKKIISYRFFFLSALLLTLINSTAIGQSETCGKQSPLYINSAAVNWTGTQFFNRDVILTGTSSLTIFEATIQFADNCQLLVESGADLSVGNSTLTNSCGGLWTGIISMNNVTLTNSKIEHAATAVSRQGGSGSITASNTEFTNNRRDVEYLNKPSGSTDNFEDCSFLVNNNYRGTSIRPRVTMWNSQGINFLGCTFNNTHSDPLSLSSNPAFEWQGISAVGSNFYVDEFDGKSSSFTNFHVGIRTAHLDQNRNAQIRNSRFTNNQTGILSENVNSLVVYKNKFNLNSNTSFPIDPWETSTWWYIAGLVINTGSSYDIRNNEFIGNLPNANGTQYLLGAQIIKTGDGQNYTEGNRFRNLYVGQRILGRNRNIVEPPSGLQLLCGENSQNIYDQTIEKFDEQAFLAGIRGKQGHLGNPDGNRFSNDATAFDIWSDAQFYERFYQDTLTNARANPTTGPLAQTAVFPASNCITFVPFMRRPNNNVANNSTVRTEVVPLSAAELSELANEYEEVDAALKKVQKQYVDLLDGGNQGQLMSNIRTRWNNDSAALRRNLLAFSPNLSGEVLAVAAQLNVLSNPSLMSILRANPSACRSNKLVKVLKQDLRQPFSDADIQALQSVPTRGAQRYDLEDAMNTHSSKRGLIARSLINGMIGDEERNREQLRYWWKRIGTQSALYSLAESYVKDNQSANFEAQLRNVSRDLADFELQAKENDDYVELYGIKSKVLKSGRSWKEMTASEIEKVRRIANSTRADAGVQANNILCYALGECKPLVVPRLATNGFTPQSEPVSALVAAKPNSQFTAYPNPARNTINVDYNLTDKFEEAYISLFDFTGREIKRQKLVNAQSQVQWQTEQMQSGLYLISIYADNRLVWKTKVSIQK